MNSLQQQARFDDFVQEFSTEPPHEALAMNRVAEAVGRAMHDFGDHGKRANSACSKARNEQELREIERTAFGGGRQVAVQAPGDDIFHPDVMMVEHRQMRQ
jgi:hypothetical protein